MKTLPTTIPKLTLVSPNPVRDAPFAVSWFTSSQGKQTLLLMGNAQKNIQPSTLRSETRTIQRFLELEATGKQLTWAIRYADTTIGAIWVELVDTKHLKSPAVHIMIGAPEYRGRGLGKAAMQAVIDYVRTELHAKTLYSRHLAGNTVVARMNDSLGFVKDGESYSDKDGLVFQNIKLSLTA